jgi:hypothetical protein
MSFSEIDANLRLKWLKHDPSMPYLYPFMPQALALNKKRTLSARRLMGFGFTTKISSNSNAKART